jgi:DNA-binding transcriptional regulator LsrR (DeoR family)
LNFHSAQDNEVATKVVAMPCVGHRALGELGVVMRRVNEQRLISRVARMYYLHNATQASIAETLKLSQATVSRLIKSGRDEDIVRITVSSPRGTYPDLEDGLLARFGLADAIVADCEEDREEQILEAIGDAAGHYLELTLKDHDIVGISSWSQTVLRVLDNIHPVKSISAAKVVQTLGGMGKPGMDEHATVLTTRLARLLSAEPVLLPAPGVASSEAAKIALLSDGFVRAATEEFRNITVALMGVGALQPSEMLARSGNVFSRDELESAASAGAVGELSLRFFDRDGKPVRAPLDQRVIGISLDELRAVPRVIMLAGGDRKVEALHAALSGGYAKVFVTDRFTATKLLECDEAADSSV